MKQFIFTIIFLAATLAVAQKPDLPLVRAFINEAIVDTDAVINQEIDLEDEKYVTIITSAPDYYQVEIVVAVFNQIVNKYSNVSYSENWREDGLQYRAFIKVNDNLLLVTWHPTTKKINYSY